MIRSHSKHLNYAPSTTQSSPTDSPDQNRSIGDRFTSKNMSAPQPRRAQREISLGVVDVKEDYLIRSHYKHLKHARSTSESSLIGSPDQDRSISDKFTSNKVFLKHDDSARHKCTTIKYQECPA